MVGALLGTDMAQARMARFGDMDFYKLTTVAYSQFFLGNAFTGILNLIVLVGFSTAAFLILKPLITRLMSILGGFTTVSASLGQTSLYGVATLYDHVADAGAATHGIDTETLEMMPASYTVTETLEMMPTSYTVLM